jgi:hypothetical protein
LEREVCAASTFPAPLLSHLVHTTIYTGCGFRLGRCVAYEKKYGEKYSGCNHIVGGMEGDALN